MAFVHCMMEKKERLFAIHSMTGELGRAELSLGSSQYDCITTTLFVFTPSILGVRLVVFYLSHRSLLNFIWLMGCMKFFSGSLAHLKSFVDLAIIFFSFIIQM